MLKVFLERGATDVNIDHIDLSIDSMGSKILI